MLQTDAIWLSRIAANAWLVALGIASVVSGLVAAFGYPSHPFASAPWFLVWVGLAFLGFFPCLPVAWTLARRSGEAWFVDGVGRARILVLGSWVAFEGIAFALVVGFLAGA